MLNPTHPDLIVGRDRAHVRALLKDYPGAEVISASAFFDKVRLLAFMHDSQLRRDDHGPLIIAQSLLSARKDYPLRFAQDFAALFSACYHGTSAPSDVLPAIGHLSDELKNIFKILAHIEQTMNEKSITTGVGALYKSFLLIKNHHIKPPGLNKIAVIELQNLVDLTLLEIEVIKALSRVGLQFIIRFPLDFNQRGINAAVDFSARQFEKGDDTTAIDIVFEDICGTGPLATLVANLFSDNKIGLDDTNCVIDHAIDIFEEAHTIASRIAQIRTEFPKDTIVLSVRTIDARAAIYKRAVQALGITVRDRKGESLVKTNIGLLLQTIFSARLGSLPRKDILSLLHNSLFSLYVNDPHKRKEFLYFINELGIDDQYVKVDDPGKRYFSQIERFKAILAEDDPRQQSLSDFNAFIQSLIVFLELLPFNASFQGFLVAVMAVVDKAFSQPENHVVKAIKDTVQSLLQSPSFSSNDTCINLRDFISIFYAQLSRITIPYDDNRDVSAVEFLPLPELLGRSFDHVFIPDISFLRLPHNAEPDPLLDDQARIVLNQALKKPFLRVFFDDPFEPLPTPPRQALEPFWFAMGIAACQKSIHFSCALRDEQGAELAPSEFFLWLLEHVQIQKTTKSKEFVPPEKRQFLAAINKKNQHQPLDFLPVLAARTKAFLHKTPDPFAFSFPASAVIKQFLGSLDVEPTKELSPTTIEAFASCPFKGFAERLWGLKKIEHKDDVDLRVLGQVAHRALEIYFSGFSLVADKTLNKKRFQELFRDTINDYVRQNFIAHKDVFMCQTKALESSILVLLDVLLLIADSSAMKKELAFGHNRKHPALSITANGRRYLLGGRIDRLDMRKDGFLIVDYKLSSSATLRADLSAQKILRTHFQMPVYLRLVAAHLADNDQEKVSFAFASIRDAELLGFSAEKNGALFERIFDDEGKEGFAQAIDTIFAPIRQGEVLAVPGDHCEYCDFHHLCRKSEQNYA